ncbi:hypothetical protein HDK77DRAFT_444631 [Phyllosticta capitalensis]
MVAGDRTIFLIFLFSPLPSSAPGAWCLQHASSFKRSCSASLYMRVASAWPVSLAVISLSFKYHLRQL